MHSNESESQHQFFNETIFSCWYFWGGGGSFNRNSNNGWPFHINNKPIFIKYPILIAPFSFARVHKYAGYCGCWGIEIIQNSSNGNWYNCEKQRMQTNITQFVHAKLWCAVLVLKWNSRKHGLHIQFYLYLAVENSLIHLVNFSDDWPDHHHPSINTEMPKHSHFITS